MDRHGVLLGSCVIALAVSPALGAVGGDPTGACCNSNGTCTDGTTEAECTGTGGVSWNEGDFCFFIQCPDAEDIGACCLPDDTCSANIESGCATVGGNFQGAGTDCEFITTCTFTGACCLPDTSCVDDLDEAGCAGVGGSYLGDQASCPIAACCVTSSCPEDLSGNDQVDFADILTVIGAWGACTGCCPEDLSGNGVVDFADVLATIGAWGTCPGPG